MKGETHMDNTATVASAYDVGLRRYMTGIFNKMGLGLLLTAAIMYIVSAIPELSSLLYTTGADHKVHSTILGYIVSFAPLAVILFSNFQNARSASFAFWAVVTLFGLSLSVITMIYTSVSLATTFLVCASGFGGLAIWGYTTKTNLSGIGNFLLYALVGLIVAMLVNVFLLHSGVFDMVISGIGVLLFSALTAYDTQRLKNEYDPSAPADQLSAQTSSGALSLYLDFINLFLFLLRFIGVKKD